MGKYKKRDLGLFLIFFTPILLYNFARFEISRLIINNIRFESIAGQELSHIFYYIETGLNIMLMILYFYITSLYIIMKRSKIGSQK